MPEAPTNQPSAAAACGGVQLYHPSTYGSLGAIVQRRRIEVWLDAVPDGDQLVDAAVPADMTVDLYADWLVWAGSTALHYLDNLDKLERQFRKAALAYHKIPYQTRHSSTLLSGAKASPVTLKILSQIFESDESRSRLRFFKPFYAIKDAAVDVIFELRRRESTPLDIDKLRYSERKCEKALEPLSQLIFELLKNLKWLREIVNEIRGRAGTDGKEALAQKHSREGGLFRLWMLSLPEVEFGLDGIQWTYVDWYAERLLEYGVEHDTHWSKMADLVDL
ncbi:hypothetical protein IQ06DRAFT_134693 [Phaeosphaeriaceae sp. SRC1lsM3a]|nr:hypothetical protein IQ06DRAFT_134693 [Stagonospora sp. SRC1lsM3a]